MKKLSELFPCDYDTLIYSIEEDSRVRTENYLFCCIKGTKVDGHDYVHEAIQNGAVAILSEKDLDVDVPVIKVSNTKKAMFEVLSRFYNEIDNKMKLIGVTGTDGKTTVASIIYQLLNLFDKAGYIGTNGIECYGYRSSEFHLTTPPPKALFNSFTEFFKRECNYASMEVSSEGLLANRVDGLLFDVAIFTNLTKDHINNHKTYTNYRECKGKLFQMIKQTGICIINNDDSNASYFKKVSVGKVVTYGINNKADYMASDIVVLPQKLSFKLHTPTGVFCIDSPLSGKYNVYNLMASIITCYHFGYDMNEIIENIKKLKPIKGRVDIIDYKEFKVIIDYAHTANALKNVLEYARILASNNIITVAGSAGGRDNLKRSEIGKIVTSLSNYVIFTMDDPRNEDPNDIIDDIISNLDSRVRNYERVIDRPLAIKRALKVAREGDVVLIAGRGNDTFIPIGNQFIRCNDYEEVYKNMKMEVNV